MLLIFRYHLIAIDISVLSYYCSDCLWYFCIAFLLLKFPIELSLLKFLYRVIVIEISLSYHYYWILCNNLLPFKISVLTYLKVLYRAIVIEISVSKLSLFEYLYRVIIMKFPYRVIIMKFLYRVIVIEISVIELSSYFCNRVIIIEIFVI